MKAPFFKTPYNHDTEAESNKHTVKDFGESLTVQSMADDADINVLMHRYGITGKMPENPRVPTYVDFEDVFDFRTANEAVMKANDMFMEYPATLRARFDNDPQRFLAFCSDENNKDEMRNLGLLKPQEPPKVEPPPMKVEVINPTPKA